jgi:hypothetical protein
MFWASSYNLFVTWSVNGQHPWDNMPAAGKPAATLEIGCLRGSNNKVRFPGSMACALPKPFGIVRLSTREHLGATFLYCNVRRRHVLKENIDMQMQSKSDKRCSWWLSINLLTPKRGPCL